MSDFKTLLNLLAKEGYPSEKTKYLFGLIRYDHEEFLNDLIINLGYKKASEFVKRTLLKLSHSKKEIIIRCELPYSSGKDSWIDLVIHDFNIDSDEEYSDVMITWSWGDSKIINPDDGYSVTTLDDIRSEVDMGEWSEFDDFVNEIKGDCYQKIVDNCGFGIWFN